MVAALPAQNLSARLVAEARSGRVVAPGDTTGFVAACEGLLADPATARRMGRNARLYAERNFPIEGIAERFGVAIARALGAAVTP
jgi:glycosyltransferase involved in cell wall biosynthesis